MFVELLLAVWGREWADVLHLGWLASQKGLSVCTGECKDHLIEWMFLLPAIQKISSNLVPYFVNFLLEVLFLAPWHIFVSLSQQLTVLHSWLEHSKKIASTD